MSKQFAEMGKVIAAGIRQDLAERESPTPRTDAYIGALESELGDGPPCISDAAIDVAVRLRLTSFARQLERDLNVANVLNHWDRMKRAENQYDDLREALKKIAPLIDEALIAKGEKVTPEEFDAVQNVRRAFRGF